MNPHSVIRWTARYPGFRPPATVRVARGNLKDGESSLAIKNYRGDRDRRAKAIENRALGRPHRRDKARLANLRRSHPEGVKKVAEHKTLVK